MVRNPHRTRGDGPVRPVLWILILLCLQFAASRAARAEDPPAQELLQMMEMLQEWEMIQNLELIKQMESAGRIEHTSASEPVEMPPPQIQIEDGQKWNGNLR